MNSKIVAHSILFLSLACFACSKEASRSEEKPQSTQPGHAASDVKVGSHEDWCDEHGVPESQCTRCNATLVAAFKASGDWCDEHSRPESQCRQCNPELKITRPPKGQ